MKALYKKHVVNLRASDTVLAARKAIAAAVKLDYNRIELRSIVPAGGDAKTVKRYVGDASLLSSFGLDDDAELAVKDLGPQFAYRGVFLIEYAGPIVIVLACTLRPAFFFGAPSTPLDVAHGFVSAGSLAASFNAPEGSQQWNHFVQSLAICLWVAHFVKRELETLFVHRFSRATMPLINLLKNSIYYWGFAAAVSYPLCSAAFTAPSRANVLLGAALWAVSQLINFCVHVQLAMMRPAEGSSERKPPSGFLFALVSCPNYTAEVAGWVGWALLTHIAASYVFTLVGLLQMTQWALAKHRAYLKDSPGYKNLGRKAILPWVV